MTEVPSSQQRVFIIHGRNLNAVRELSLFLRALGLEPWPFESVSAALGANPYVGEVVEKGITQAQLVIALFTPDERASLQRDFYQTTDKESDRRRSQSRPNVFFETGMALAFAREKTIMVTAGDVELPSDFGGKLLRRLSNDAGRRKDMRELLLRMKCTLRDDDTYLDHTQHGDFSDLALFGREKLQLPDQESKGIDLLLSPGGVRCIAFAGAIDALVHNGYKIDRVCGISGGAVIGATFAANADPQALIDLVGSENFLKEIRPPSWWQLPKVLKKPFAANRAIPLEWFANLLGSDLAFSELRVPLGVTALDITRGRLLAYTSDSHPSMKVAEALLASTAIPPGFPSVQAADRMIVDAGIQTQCPLWLLSAFHRPRKNRAVALSVGVRDFRPPKNFPAYLARLFEGAALATDHLEVLQSRRLIRIPISVRDHDYLAALDGPERMELISQGREAVHQAIQSGLFDLPDQAPRIARYGQRDPHDIAETEANNAAIRYAREIQRFSSELDDD